MGEPGFWEDEGRVAVLGGIELRDRIESGLRSANSLMHRIRSARRPPAELVRRAAQRVLLLGEALDALEAGEPPTRPCASTATPSSRPASSPCTAPGPASAACASRAPRSAANRRYRWQATVTGFGALQHPAPRIRPARPRGPRRPRRLRPPPRPRHRHPRGRPDRVARPDRPPLPRTPHPARPRRRPRLAHRPPRHGPRRRLRPRRVDKGRSLGRVAAPGRGAGGRTRRKMRGDRSGTALTRCGRGGRESRRHDRDRARPCRRCPLTPQAMTVLYRTHFDPLRRRRWRSPAAPRTPPTPRRTRCWRRSTACPSSTRTALQLRRLRDDRRPPPRVQAPPRDRRARRRTAPTRTRSPDSSATSCAAACATRSASCPSASAA